MAGWLASIVSISCRNDSMEARNLEHGTNGADTPWWQEKIFKRILYGFTFLQHMVLDSGQTGQQCTRLQHRGGPFSYSSWSREGRRLTSWQWTPSPPCMRHVYRDRPSVSDCCWTLVHRWDCHSDVLQQKWLMDCILCQCIINLLLYFWLSCGSVLSRWMLVTSMAALRCVMPVQLVA